MRSQRYPERLISLLSVGAVIAALVWIDSRVRERFWSMVDQAAHGEVPWADNVRMLAEAMFDSAQQLTLDNAPMVVFTFVAVVLVLFMLRT